MTRLGLGFTVLALAGCTGRGTAEAPRVGGYRGEVIPPFAVTDFTLPTTDGEPFHFREQSRGFVTLLFFGYTHCPDVCPLHMANLAAVLHAMPSAVAQRVKVIFVTVDPSRDTPAELRAWLNRFDPTFVGLRGPLDSVNRVQQGFLLSPTVIEPLPDGGYAVGHSAAVIAIVADSVRVLYPFGTRQEDWAQDLPKLVASMPARESD